MKIQDTLKLIKTVQAWHGGSAQLSDVAEILEAQTTDLNRFLFANGFIDTDGKTKVGISFVDVMFALTLLETLRALTRHKERYIHNTRQAKPSGKLD